MTGGQTLALIRWCMRFIGRRAARRHRAEAAFLCSDERMFEHEAGDTSALRRRRRHISTICDVIPTASLICT
jgi:hypothetical protein